MRIAGIDPGMRGAFVVLDAKLRRVVRYWDTPIREGSYDIEAMKSICREAEYDIAVMERLHAMPRNGSISSFKLGFCCGLWNGMIPGELMHISPQRWRRCVGIQKGKGASMAMASEIFPELPLRRDRGRKNTMDGRADAALMALAASKILEDGGSL